LKTYCFILDWIVIMFVCMVSLGGQVSSDIRNHGLLRWNELRLFIVSDSPLWYMHYIQGRIGFEALSTLADFEHNSMVATGTLFEGCICGWRLQGFNLRERRILRHSLQGTSPFSRPPWCLSTTHRLIAQHCRCIHLL
jgi:hypothetical protein